MALFEIVAPAGLKMIRCVIENEMVRAESGALHYMRGNIELTSAAPSVGGFLKSVMTRENIFRPTYQGTGEIFFGPPTFGEYEILELKQEEWILEQGSYVCSDASIEVGVWRNKALTALFGGEGWFQTSVKGTGKVVMQAPGRVQRIDLRGEKLSVDGKFAIARTASVNFEVQKAAKSILGSLSSGEGLLSTFTGHGTVLIAPVPNTYQSLLASITQAIPRGK
ncbi:MAG TPA: AIM24 family protein [Pirellulaceae bacterium]|nr:AIM24 family protein [Pirellulaceae bacterium]